MMINNSKTKTMVIAKEQKRHKITLGDTTLEQVISFKYLGATIGEDGKMNEELINRTSNAGKLYYAINRGDINKKEVNKKTKIAVYKAIYIPTLRYSCESWTLLDTHRSKMDLIGYT
jgi:hypothetical protein